MGVKKTAGDSKKAQATAYKTLGKAGKNKAAKLARHLKAHPNDVQASKAVGTAANHKGRKQPMRTGARLNPYVGEQDRIALLEKEKDMFVVSRSLNLLSGRISEAGRRILKARSEERATRNQAQFDKAGKVFPKARLTKAEQQLAKARALGKAEAAGVSKAKRKAVAKAKRKA